MENQNTIVSPNSSSHSLGGQMCDYVANLQLHMTLQARNLLPTLNNNGDSRELMLQETQANFEKIASRQPMF